MNPVISLRHDSRWHLALSGLILSGVLCSAQAQDRFPPPGQNATIPARVNPTPSAAVFPSQRGMATGQPGGVAPTGANLSPGMAAAPASVPGSMPGTPTGAQGSGGGFQMPPPAATGGQQGFQQEQQGQRPNLSAQARQELQDFGIAPTAQLHAGAMHGPTPTQIPGGKVTTTEQLSRALQSNNGQILLFHVLGGRETLPNAQNAMPASAGGTFDDQTQQAFARYLNQVTKGQKGQPLVFYCASPQCWMSYNAALRAINNGFTNVLWYRGGIEAWKAARLPTTMQ